jgi:hypothetical protein
MDRHLIYIRLDVEKAGLQMSNNLDTAAAEGLKATHGIDDEVQRVHGTLDAVYNRTIDVDDVRNTTIRDIGSRIIDGAQVIPNQSFTPS